MKNLLFVLVLVFFSCSSNSGKTSTTDSANAIDENNTSIQDTTVSPMPNGYAPPNSKTDTTQNIKDSLRKRNGH